MRTLRYAIKAYVVFNGAKERVVIVRCVVGTVRTLGDLDHITKKDSVNLVGRRACESLVPGEDEKSVLGESSLVNARLEPALEPVGRIGDISVYVTCAHQ